MSIRISATLFDRLKDRQRAGSVPPEVASLGEAIWLHTDMGPSAYLLRDGQIVVTDAFDPDAPPKLCDDDEAVAWLVCAAKTLSAPDLLEGLHRPSGARGCIQCGGGRWCRPALESPEGEPIIVCPECGGRGWTSDSDRAARDG